MRLSGPEPPLRRIGAEQGLSVMGGSDLALSIALGVVLAAATGFRVFLPMLIVSGAAYTGHLSLDNSFAWLGTSFALTMLGVAALVEVLAYYVPGIDNLLDALATPAAFVAGTVVSAAVMTDLPPMVKWMAAVIAGGGTASLTQGITTILRAKSSVFDGRVRQPGHLDRGTRWFGSVVTAGSGGAIRGARRGHLANVVRGSPDPATTQGTQRTNN